MRTLDLHMPDFLRVPTDQARALRDFNEAMMVPEDTHPDILAGLDPEWVRYDKPPKPPRQNTPALTPALTQVTPDEGDPQMESYFINLFSNKVPDAVRERTRDETYALLDSRGADYFLEEIARGSVPVEIAFRYEVSLVHFTRWLDERVAPEDMEYVNKICANTMAAKSRVALEHTPGNAQEARMTVEYSKRNLELAERIDPDGWSGGKRPKADIETRAPMQIAIIMQPGQAPIPGTENLAGMRPLNYSGNQVSE